MVGPLELAILIGWLLPIVVTGVIARARNRSLHYCWWPAFLGWIGGVIGIVVILVQGEKPRPPASV